MAGIGSLIRVLQNERYYRLVKTSPQTRADALSEASGWPLRAAGPVPSITSHTSKAHRRPEETPLEHAIMDRVDTLTICHGWANVSGVGGRP